MQPQTTDQQTPPAATDPAPSAEPTPAPAPAETPPVNPSAPASAAPAAGKKSMNKWVIIAVAVVVLGLVVWFLTK